MVPIRQGIGFIGREDGPDVFVHYFRIKVLDIALIRRRSVDLDRGGPKGPKPPMSKENLSEHSFRKMKTSHSLRNPLDSMASESKFWTSVHSEPLIQKPFAGGGLGGKKSSF